MKLPGSTSTMSSSTPGKSDRRSLIRALENSITNFSIRKDPAYFKGRAGLIRMLNFALSIIAIFLLIPGYWPMTLNREDVAQVDIIRMMGDNSSFSGYNKSKYTLASIALGGSTAAISLIFISLLFFVMEVRCDLIWERINQKSHVVACILSVLAAFCDVLSIQEIHDFNCRTERCLNETEPDAESTYVEVFYPPYFGIHYAAFVLFLSNAILYSIASRIWLRNED